MVRLFFVFLSTVNLAVAEFDYGGKMIWSLQSINARVNCRRIYIRVGLLYVIFEI